MRIVCDCCGVLMEHKDHLHPMSLLISWVDEDGKISDNWILCPECRRNMLDVLRHEREEWKQEESR